MRLPVEHLDEENVDDSYFLNILHAREFRESPENSLSVAVLAEAISLLINPRSPLVCRKDYILAQQWLRGEYESHPGFSFAEIADRLGWDPDRLLQGVSDYIERYSGKPIKGLFVRGNSRLMMEEAE